MIVDEYIVNVFINDTLDQ